MAISIEAPENRVSDGVISLAPFELADTDTVMKWDVRPASPSTHVTEVDEAGRRRAQRVQELRRMKPERPQARELDPLSTLFEASGWSHLRGIVVRVD